MQYPFKMLSLKGECLVAAKELRYVVAACQSRACSGYKLTYRGRVFWNSEKNGHETAPALGVIENYRILTDTLRLEMQARHQKALFDTVKGERRP